MTQAERKAFYLGRSDGFEGERREVSEFSDGEAEEYKRGYRQAIAEERLNARTDWD